MNPFSEEVNKDNLFNIGTDKSSKEEAAEFLQNVNDIGQKACEGSVFHVLRTQNALKNA